MTKGEIVGEIVIDANMDLTSLMPPPCWRCWRSPAEVDEDPQIGHEAPTHLDVSFDASGAPLLALDVDLDEIVILKMSAQHEAISAQALTLFLGDDVTKL